MEVRSDLRAAVDPCGTLGRIAAVLGEVGPGRLPQALESLVDGLGLRSAVLRDAPAGPVLAVAGDVIHAIPLSRRPAARSPERAVVELPVRGAGRHVATLTVVGARPAQLPVLRAVTSVLALGLRAEVGPGTTDEPSLPIALLEAADAEAEALADSLHDGALQELVYARYAADAALSSGSSAVARDAVQSALVALRRALWQVRPRGDGPDGLLGALSALSAQRVLAGAPPLLLDLDPTAARSLSPAAASTSYRLVQAAAGPEPLRIVLRRREDDVVLEIRGGFALPLAPWAARMRALGAVLTSTEGLLRLVFLLDQRATP